MFLSITKISLYCLHQTANNANMTYYHADMLNMLCYVMLHYIVLYYITLHFVMSYLLYYIIIFYFYFSFFAVKMPGIKSQMKTARNSHVSISSSTGKVYHTKRPPLSTSLIRETQRVARVQLR